MKHLLAIVILLEVVCPCTSFAQSKPPRLSSVDLKDRVIWGSECIVNDDLGLAFGGQDQESESGSPGTRVRVKGEWQPLASKATTDQAVRWQTLDAKLSERLAWLRGNYFGRAEVPGGPTQSVSSQLASIRELRSQVEKLYSDASTSANSTADKRRAAELLDRLKLAMSHADPASLTREKLGGGDVDLLRDLSAARVRLQQASALLRDEPLPRALSPLVYDEKSQLFVLFGGDHLDFLMNDTWTFDPKTNLWSLRLPKTAPPPRANHKLVASGDGTIKLTGGYTYTSSTDYMGGQYKDLGDGDWTFDLATNEWSGGKGVEPIARTYRTGKFLPEYYLQGPQPDAVTHAEVLEALPANEWVALKPPHLPEMNRDWGTAILDPDRDLILRWSGGHCAHSGSDVLHYHIATNRWELPYAVELPLGQCYTNTEFPEGVNFNRRPWVTGHTYQNYGYDPLLKKMLFTGRDVDCFVYDPDVADWTARFAKPKGMAYGSCFYTLTCTSTPQGLVCWTNDGRLFQYDRQQQWIERKLSGEKMPGSVVDNSTIVHDAKRNRLLAVFKSYGDKNEFSGDLWAIDCETWVVSKVSPTNRAAGAKVPYLCQLRYDAQNDILLVGGTLEPDESGLRRTPAYDCAKNEWISLKITGDDPSGAKGRNVSLGMMYDAKRKLFWAVDTKSHVFVLKLDVASVDRKVLD